MHIGIVLLMLVLSVVVSIACLWKTDVLSEGDDKNWSVEDKINDLTGWFLATLLVAGIWTAAFFVMKDVRTASRQSMAEDAEVDRQIVQQYLIDHDERLAGKERTSIKFEVEGTKVMVITAGDTRFVVDDPMAYEYTSAYINRYGGFSYDGYVEINYQWQCFGCSAIIAVVLTVLFISVPVSPVRKILIKVPARSLARALAH